MSGTVGGPHELAERALAAAGGDAVVVVTQTHQANLRWARSTLTTNGETTNTSVAVVAFAGGARGPAVGAVSADGPTPAEVVALAGRARAAAEAAEPAEDAAALVAGGADPGWEEPAEPTSAAALARLAEGLGEVFAAGRADGVEHFGYAEHVVATTWLASTTGLRRRHVQPTSRLEATAKSHGRTRSAWAGRTGRDFAGADVAGLDAELRRALAWQARRVGVAPGRHDALLTPSAAADLMVELYWSATAREAAEGRSVFSGAGGPDRAATRVGERLGPAGLSLVSDPGGAGFDALRTCGFEVAAASSSASSVFDNGLPLARTAWVDDGVLAALLGPRAVASQTGLPVSPGVDNLVLTAPGGGGDLDALVARTDRALLVTCLWYNRVVDPRTLLLTGLTRDGVYLVEGGEVVGAAGNFRFNDSPVDVLSRVADAGATVPALAREMGDYFPRAAMPPLRVAGFHLSTASDAQ